MQVKEGSATFWRASRFKEQDRRDIMLRDLFKEDPPLSLSSSQGVALSDPAAAAPSTLSEPATRPLHAARWRPMLDASPELVRALQKVTHVTSLLLSLPSHSVNHSCHRSLNALRPWLPIPLPSAP